MMAVQEPQTGSIVSAVVVKGEFRVGRCYHRRNGADLCLQIVVGDLQVKCDGAVAAIVVGGVEVVGPRLVVVDAS